MYKMHIRHPNCIYAKEKKDKTRAWIHITRRVRIRHPNCSHTKQKKEKREFLHYQGVIRSIESAGEKNSWSQGHWVRPLWMDPYSTQRTGGGGSIIAMNYNEPVTESDSLRCSSRCSSIKVFFFALLVPEEFERAPGSRKRGAQGTLTEAAAYESSVYAGKMLRRGDTQYSRRTRGLSFVATANLTGFLVLLMAPC